MPTCRACGCEILWALTEAGKRIPLDVGPGVYCVSPAENWVNRQAHAVRAMNFDPARGTHGFAVSHFDTCPARARPSLTPGPNKR
jgi:hypothetical protein